MKGMRLNLILPVVDPKRMVQPEKCPYEKCSGEHFKMRQEVKKAFLDSEYQQVRALRCECMKCRRTFRVYPQGVQAGQVSQRIKGIAVMLYVLGLSYGAVSIVMEALGVFLSKTSVYRSVQAAGEAVPGMKRTEILSGCRTKALGADVTGVKCKGEWLRRIYNDGQAIKK